MNNLRRIILTGIVLIVLSIVILITVHRKYDRLSPSNLSSIGKVKPGISSHKAAIISPILLSQEKSAHAEIEAPEYSGAQKSKLIAARTMRWETLGRYSRLLAQIDLPDDKKRTFYALLVARQYSSADAVNAVRRVNAEATTPEVEDAIKAAAQSADMDLKTFLGADAYNQFSDLEKKENDRSPALKSPGNNSTNIEVGYFIDAGLALTPEQLAGLNAVRLKMSQIFSGNQAVSGLPDGALTETQQYILDNARSILSEAQLSAYEGFFRQQNDFGKQIGVNFKHGSDDQPFTYKPK
jgi:hypothetical protein